MATVTFATYDGSRGTISITRDETRRTYAPHQGRIEQLTALLLEDSTHWMIYRLPPAHPSSRCPPSKQASWIAYPTRPGMDRFLTRQAEYAEACARSRRTW